jgi:FkbM family methyltransferase
MIEKVLRKIPSFRGKQRLARFLFKSKIINSKDIFIKGQYNCSYKFPNLKENIGFELFINGVYEPSAIEFIISQTPENGFMIDIGANIGTIALPVLNTRKDINAICIEASPRVFEYLKFNKQYNNISNCVLINKALTDVDGEIVNFFSPGELFGKGSLSSVYTKDSEKIETISLDSLLKMNRIENVDFIKIDVEGYEYAVFKGSNELLSKNNAPDIFLEFADWAEGLSKNANVGDAQKILFHYGYKLFCFKNRGWKEIESPLQKGSAALFATKNKNWNRYLK